MLEVCAEISSNHLGNFDRAMALVKAAADAGADLVKFQLWSPDSMCVSPTYKIADGPWAGRNLRDLYREAFTPWEWMPKIFAYARLHGLEPFAAAFDKPAVDYLETLGVKRHKVASFEIVDLPLIRHMAFTRKPIIVSTGMASDEEIDDALSAAYGGGEVTILRCVSAYPADPADTRLGPWSTLWPWGLSDHSVGIGVACAAATLGATYIEKHLTMDRGEGGLDAQFSLQPGEFGRLVVECRRATAAVQPKSTQPKGENKTLRRTLWVAKDTAAGEPLVLDANICTARPALGVHCDTNLRHKVARRPLKAGEPLTEECIA